MTPWRLIYTLLLAAATPLILLRLVWRARKQPAYLRHVGERFGYYPSQPDGPLIWLHVVSVGETRAAEPLVKALRRAYPDHQILLTHMTPTGRDTGQQLFGDGVLRCYLPYDLPPCIASFLRHFRPRLGVLMETELWPNLIHACRARALPLYLVNARLSERSARGYARLARLTQSTLAALTAIGAQAEADAQRLRALGAPRVIVTGNLKFDRGPQPKDLELGARLRVLLGGELSSGAHEMQAPSGNTAASHHPVAARHPSSERRGETVATTQGGHSQGGISALAPGEGESQRVIVLAASTREGEEELILDAVAALPREALIVIVPRHPQRFDEVAALLQRRGIAFQRRTGNREVSAHTRVLLGDSMGELFAYYAACDVAFIGGSLLPLGGQNLLEACAAGKPVVIGPHVFNFTEATRLAVAAGAAIQVADVAGLATTLTSLLADATKRQEMGEAGLALMRQHQGATERTMALLAGPLPAERPS